MTINLILRYESGAVMPSPGAKELVARASLAWQTWVSRDSMDGIRNA